MQKIDRYIPTILAILSFMAVLGIFSFSGEPVPVMLRGGSVESILLKLGRANSIGFNLCVGFLTSVFFWLLVAHIPEQNRRALLRDNFQRRYLGFRESTIQIILWCAEGSHDSDLPKQLLNQVAFRSYFDADKKKRWYAFLNGLQGNEDRMTELLLELEIFSQEVGYLLNHINIQDAEVHAFFKRLNEHIYRLKNAKVYSHDLVKYVAGFLWELNSNWNIITGYQKEDPIAKMIAAL